MATRDDIIAALMAGETPYRLSKKYPRASVYRIYNELVESGQIGDAEVIHAENLERETSSRYPFEPADIKTQPQTIVVEKEEAHLGKTGAEVIDFTGPKGLPISAINRIRGVLGISLRPKVLSMPTPELLYPAMVISITELGFPAMRPDDFIDTILYQWLDACDIVPYAFMKKSELEELAKKYSDTEETIKDKKFRQEHGLVTTGEIREAVLEPLVDKEKEMVDEMKNEPPGDLTEDEEIEQVPFLKQIEEDIGATLEPELELELEPDNLELPEYNRRSAWQEKENKKEPQPHKPTVGELLAKLNINNIRKEVENGSTGRAEPDSSQSEPKPRE